MAVTISISSITQNSQNIANNTSNVTVKLIAKWTGGSWNHYGTANGWLKIDGTSYSFSGVDINPDRTTTGSQTLITKTVNVSHNSDGTKTLNCSASFDTGIDSSGTQTATASKTLTTIPRKSSLTASNGTLDTAQTLTISRASSSFTHTIKYQCGDLDGTIVTKTTSTSVSWTPPLILAQENTTGSSVSVTLTLETFSGSTSLGTTTKTITCTIPDSVKPNVSISVSDPMGYADTYGYYIQGLSKIAVTITATGKGGAPVKTYSTTADGNTYTTKSVTTGVISNTGELTIKTTVKDSRGRTASASVKINVAAYAVPRVTDVSSYRSDANGVSSPSGSYLAVKFSASITALNNQNTAAYTITYKKSSATSYTIKTLTDYKNQYSVTDGVFVFAADNSSYDITLTVKDAFKTIKKAIAGSSVSKFFSILRGGIGLAIGKIAELEATIDCNWHIRARKGITVDSEWIDLTIDDAFALYQGSAINQPKYKVTGNVVTVWGILSPKAEFQSAATQVTIATGILPEHRPKVWHSFICQGSGINRWNCAVGTDGRITMARYGASAYATVPTNAWLTFSVTYQI